VTELTEFHHQVLDHLSRVVSITRLVPQSRTPEPAAPGGPSTVLQSLCAELGIESADCPECDGYGWHDDDCGACGAETTHECTSCDGTGKRLPHVTAEVVIGHLHTMAHDARDRLKLLGEL